MNEADPLVPEQLSIPNSLKLRLKRAAEASGKSESEIVRDALVLELTKYGAVNDKPWMQLDRLAALRERDPLAAFPIRVCR